MTHKFEFKNRKKLMSNKRKKILPTRETLLDLGLKRGDIFADIGSGIGYFTFPASDIVGPEGKIYAMDISPEMLSELKKIIEDKNILNIELVKTSESKLIVSSDIITFAYSCTVLHEVNDLDSFLREIYRIMMSNGKFVVIEWKKVKSDSGPPAGHRLESNELSEKLKEIGFQDITISHLNEYFYTITCFK